jgi:excisionase family DNA binding protein
MEQVDVLTVEEARKRLGLGRSAAYEAIRRGEIPIIRFGRRIVVPRTALERMLADAKPIRRSIRHTRRSPTYFPSSRA